MKTKKLALSAIMSAVLVISPTPAHAVAPVIDAAVVSLIGVTNTLLAAANAQLLVINGTLISIGLTLKGGTDSQMQMTMDAAHGAAKGPVSVITNVDRGNTERRFSVTDPCLIGAVSHNTGAAINETALASGGLGRNPGAAKKRLSDPKSPKGQIENLIAFAEGTAPAPNPEVTLALGASAGCSQFAAANSVRADNCLNAGFAVTAPKRPGADTNAQTIFEGPQEAGAPRVRLSINMDTDPEDSLAVKAFMRNLSTPAELRGLLPAELGSANGRKYLGLKDIYDARMSLADRPMKRQVANITENKSWIASLKDMIYDDKFVQDYLDKNKKDWQKTGVSSDEWTKIEVERRYLNIGWLAKLEKMESPEQIGREQVRIAAQHSLLLWRLTQEQRETNVLLGAILGTKVRSELLPELTAAHKAAMR